jgi:glycosyltransferase involved in cell wall biosynthesis
MKALMIAPFYEYRYGGAEFIMRIQRQCLEERGIEIDVLCLSGGPEPQPGVIWRLPLPRWLLKHPLAVKRGIIFLNNPGFDRHFFKVMRELPIPFERYDLFHCQTHYWLDMGLRLALKHHKPLALTFHDNLPREIPRDLMFPLFSLGLQWLERLQGRYLRPILRQCRWINGVSDHVDKKLARYLEPGGPPVFTIYNPTPQIATVTPEPRPPSNPPKALYIGRLSKEKGLDLLLDAFKQCQEPMRLSILGLEGPLQGMAQQAARRDSRIQLLPPVAHAEVPAFFHAHDLVCCPSVWNDPLPGTVIETRLFQKAILATDRGGIPEILDGYARAAIVKTGGLNRRELVQAMRAGLAEAATLIARPLDPEREARFLRQFSRQSFADQYGQLYVNGRLARQVAAD